MLYVSEKFHDQNQLQKSDILRHAVVYQQPRKLCDAQEYLLFT